MGIFEPGTIYVHMDTAHGGMYGNDALENVRLPDADEGEVDYRVQARLEQYFEIRHQQQRPVGQQQRFGLALGPDDRIRQYEAAQRQREQRQEAERRRQDDFRRQQEEAAAAALRNTTAREAQRQRERRQAVEQWHIDFRRQREEEARRAREAQNGWGCVVM